METKLPDLDEFFSMARRAGHDALDVSGDPEALMHLANAQWQHLSEAPTLETLEGWIDLVADVVDRPPPGAEDWLSRQLIRASFMLERLTGAAGAAGADQLVSRPSMAEAIGFAVQHVSPEVKDQIALSLQPMVAHLNGSLER